MTSAAAARTITLDIPEALYDRVQHAATSLHRRVEEVLLEVVATALPPLADLPREVGDEVASLAFENDVSLFRAARSTIAPELHAEMTALLDRKGCGEISVTEQARLDELVHEHEVLALRRAQAALLLQRRGYDMSSPDVLSQLP
jgi:hypothetical protein